MALRHSVPKNIFFLLIILRLGGSGILFCAGKETGQKAKPQAKNTDYLELFAEASEEWGNGIEAVIEDAYRRCFKTYLIDGTFLTLRMPFGENNERSELTEGDLPVVGGGKANPLLLWDEIDVLLGGEDFKTYIAALSDGKEKVLIFDLEARSWTTSQDWFYIDRLNSGNYPGLPHKPFVLSKGKGANASDVYNYVYCIGRLGMDCSGFVWSVLNSVASWGGVNLARETAKEIGISRSVDPSYYVGTWFFDPRNKLLEEVKDEIGKLMPGDMILFRGQDGNMLHSAIIQSIDFANGRIRYLQSTDEAPQSERGVHESSILFDPKKPGMSLKDASLKWTQAREATFTGEFTAPFRDDGERYRAYPENGGGTVVRFKALKKLAAKSSMKKP